MDIQNISPATRTIIIAIVLGLLFFGICRRHKKLALFLGLGAVAWAALFPYFWEDWFGDSRAVREYGEWRSSLGIGAAGLPSLLVVAGCLIKTVKVFIMLVVLG